MRKRVFTFLSVLALAVLALAQGIVVCGKCGREDRAGGESCVHCNAALPKLKTEPSAVAPLAPATPAKDAVAAEVGRGAAAVVESCVRQARELEERQPDVALCYWQNALALARIVPAGGLPAGVGEAILGGNARAMQALQRGPVPCKRCGGSGRYQMSKVDGKKVTSKAVDGLACAACKGAGSQMGFREVSKVRVLILQGRTEFERRQMVAGDVKVGRALVPAALEKSLTVRQRALVMTGMPAPCSECQLSARQTCTACRGAVWKRCDYTGCRNGTLDESRTSAGARKEIRLGLEVIKKCPKCEGLGEIPCSVCNGSGGVACSKCDGSGLAPRCTRCSETGLASCRKCAGTGEAKGAPCPECKGEAMILCATCRGEGALAR